MRRGIRAACRFRWWWTRRGAGCPKIRSAKGWLGRCWSAAEVPSCLRRRKSPPRLCWPLSKSFWKINNEKNPSDIHQSTSAVGRWVVSRWLPIENQGDLQVWRDRDQPAAVQVVFVAGCRVVGRAQLALAVSQQEIAIFSNRNQQTY